VCNILHKMKWPVIIILTIFLVGCMPTECCQECLEQANQDPAGYDISIKQCSEYDLECEMSVGECQDEKV
jgi:hypothetical protein